MFRDTNVVYAAAELPQKSDTFHLYSIIRTITNKHNNPRQRGQRFRINHRCTFTFLLDQLFKSVNVYQLLPVYSYSHKLKQSDFPQNQTQCFFLSSYQILSPHPNLNSQSNPRARGCESALCCRFLQGKESKTGQKQHNQ